MLVIHSGAFAERDGRDRVVDFRSNDTIAIDHADFDNFADVQSGISGTSRGARINLGGGDVITLDANDFLLL